MNQREKIAATIESLRSRKASVRCSEMKKLLESFGFSIKDGKRAGHKVFTHNGIAAFTTGSYDCGHGRNTTVKPAYVTSVTRLLELHISDLADFLEQ